MYTVSGSNGCGTSTAVTSITVAPLAVTAAASSTLVCQGYTSTLTATSAVSNYTWEPGTISGSVAVVAPLANTIYTVSASDGTCAGTQTVLVTTKVTPTISSSTSNTMICLGETVTLTATGAGTGGTYSWTPGGSGSSIVASPATSTLYMVIGTNSLGCSAQSQTAVVVSLPPNMSVSAVLNKTLICNGQSATLTASGATGYSWVNGPATAGNTVSPTSALTVYTVNGTHATNTCVATRTIGVAVITPSVTYSSSLNVCAGKDAILTASGASSYTWNGFPTPSGSYTTTPTASTGATLITITTVNNVSCPKTYTAFINVNTLPTLSVTPKRVEICRKETNTLTVSGANNYTWTNGTITGSVIIISPSVTTIYTVTGEDANGCETTVFYNAVVKPCTGIDESFADRAIAVFPNPSKGQITIRTELDAQVELSNDLGQHLRTITLDANNNHVITLEDLPPGIYFLKGEVNGLKLSQKIVITN